MSTKLLWAMFIAGQFLNAGNMNYQQEEGYYEINDTVYGRHPSKQRVYATKAVETLGLYGMTKLFPEYEEKLLWGANIGVWGMIGRDKEAGIKLKLRW